MADSRLKGVTHMARRRPVQDEVVADEHGVSVETNVRWVREGLDGVPVRRSGRASRLDFDVMWNCYPMLRHFEPGQIHQLLKA